MGKRPKEKEDKTANAIARYLRHSPQKLRLVLDTVRRKPVYQALSILKASPRKGAYLTTKVLNSALANAKEAGLDENRLYISKIFADAGPTFKRFRPRSMGRADRILKRTAHLSIVVKEGQKVFRKGVEPVEAEKAEPVKGKKTVKSKKKTKKKTAAAKS